MRKLLKETIVSINSTGGVNYGILTLNNGFIIQIAGENGTDILRCETFAENDSPLSIMPSNDQKTALLKLGWELPYGSTYIYWCVIEKDEEFEGFINMLVNTITNVYEASEVTTIDLHLE